MTSASNVSIRKKKIPKAKAKELLLSFVYMHIMRMLYACVKKQVNALKFLYTPFLGALTLLVIHHPYFAGQKLGCT